MHARVPQDAKCLRCLRVVMSFDSTQISGSLLLMEAHWQSQVPDMAKFGRSEQLHIAVQVGYEPSPLSNQMLQWLHVNIF